MSELTNEAASTNTEAKNDSLVDAVFDRLTHLAAEGLAATQRGLEAGARWLDGRAKVVGELATKLSA
jgi:hypothetical protein